jgi:hypothetical protein
MRETFLVQASGFDFSLALVILSRFLESKKFCARTGCAQAAPPYSAVTRGSVGLTEEMYVLTPSDSL